MRQNISGKLRQKQRAARSRLRTPSDNDLRAAVLEAVHTATEKLYGKVPAEGFTHEQIMAGAAIVEAEILIPNGITLASFVQSFPTSLIRQAMAHE